MNHRDLEANRRNPRERGQLWTVDGQDAAWREAFAKAAQMRQYELSNEETDEPAEARRSSAVAVWGIVALLALLLAVGAVMAWAVVG